MKKNLLLIIVLFGLLFTNLVHSQQYDRFVYAITDAQPGTNNWSNLRKLNLQTGEYSQLLLNGNDVSFLANDAATKTPISKPLNDPQFGQLANAAFGTGVAAIAFDKKNNRLYYTPMFIDQLRYIDLKSMQVYYVTDQGFTGQSKKSAEPGEYRYPDGYCF